MDGCECLKGKGRDFRTVGPAKQRTKVKLLKAPKGNLHAGRRGWTYDQQDISPRVKCLLYPLHFSPPQPCPKLSFLAVSKQSLDGHL